MSYALVWFKRDLRWIDHEALMHASRLGPVRCIYVIEPELWLQSGAALQHFEFIRESLQDLDEHFRSLGGHIEVLHGDMVSVLSDIWREAPFKAMFSHEETGNGWTYTRDLKVADWCKHQGAPWYEYPQFGVVRRLKNRDAWQSTWESRMRMPLSNFATLRFWRQPSTIRLTIKAPSHLQHNPPQRQLGGRTRALQTLHSFLHARSIGYRGGMSSPVSAPDACSRLSTYLAYGCISIREVVNQTRTQLALLPPQANRHRAGLTAFISRLHWHCHFIQKLESEPAIEWRNMHRGYDGLREQEFNWEYFEALKNARTGWPMVDACVVMLRETGWLNFRMRAMLVSVAAYPLWLHWRPVGEWLATQFLDYEPGIHWSQLQMQSGTTGINTTRVYNPIKQAQDHDPHGQFVKRWLPRMRNVPQTWLFQPWLIPKDSLVLDGREMDIVQPLVELSTAIRASKQRVHQLRQTPTVRAGKGEVIAKHASRQKPKPVYKQSRLQNDNKQQLGFDF